MGQIAAWCEIADFKDQNWTSKYIDYRTISGSRSREDWFFLVYFILAEVLSILGNVLMLVTIWKRRALHKPTYYLIANLCAGDLLFTLVASPMYIVPNVMRAWTLGEVACQTQAYISMVSMSLSMLMICAISIDRYFCICKPFKYPKLISKKRCIIVIAYSWGHAILVSLPPVFGWGAYCLDEYLLGCYMVWDQDPGRIAYNLVFGCLTFAPETTIICVCYVLIYRTARRARIEDQKQIPTHLRFQADQTATRLKDIITEIRALRPIFAVMGVFFACWIPFVAVRWVQMHIPLTSLENIYPTLRTAQKVTTLIITVSHYANFFIYGLLNQVFRQELIILFKRSCGN